MDNDPLIPQWIVLILLGVAAICVAINQRRWFLLQYLFFVRYPLMLGAVLFSFPLLVPRTAPQLLENLFVLRPVPIAAVLFYACLCAWSIAYTGVLTWRSVPLRNGLCLARAEDAKWGNGHRLPTFDLEVLTDRSALISLLLVAPLAWRLVREADTSFWPAFGMSILGVVAAIIARRASAWFARTRFPAGIKKKLGREGTSTDALRGRLWTVYKPALRMSDPDKWLAGGPEQLKTYRILHWRAFLFAVFAFALYLIGAATGPFFPTINARIPPLMYLLALFMVLVWVLGWFAFLCDDSRAPTLALALVLLIAWHAIWPADHVYPVVDWPHRQRLDSREALSTLTSTRGQTLVVVTASGGGLTASYWTAYVLQQLGGASVP